MTIYSWLLEKGLYASPRVVSNVVREKDDRSKVESLGRLTPWPVLDLGWG